MIAALGSLASYALPKLLTFASKKLFGSRIGSALHRNLGNRGMQTVFRNVGRNYKKMMNNTYNDTQDPYQNAQDDQSLNIEKLIPKSQQQQYQDEDINQLVPTRPQPKRRLIPSKKAAPRANMLKRKQIQKRR